MNSPSVFLASPFIVTPEMLEADGIHLHPPAGDQFLKQLLQDVQTFITSGSDDVTLTDEVHMLSGGSSDEDSLSVHSVQSGIQSGDRIDAILKIVQSNSKRLHSIRPLKESVSRLAERSGALETQVRLRRQRDNLVFARIKEESDGELNRSREDRVVISGLDRFSGSLTSHQEKKDHYKAVVADLVLKACPDLDPVPSILDVIVNLRREGNPSIEVKFSSVAAALTFRKAAASLAKAEDPNFVRLFFANSITQATRVRIEIMKAISLKLTTPTEKAYVQGFISRPVLRYLSRDPAVTHCAGTGRSYSFVDSVNRFGDLLLQSELTTAYRRAGSTFRGAMEQYFVVLNEADDLPVASGSNQVPVGHRGGRGFASGTRGGPRGGARGARGRKRNGDSPPGTPFRKKTSS